MMGSNLKTFCLLFVVSNLGIFTGELLLADFDTVCFAFPALETIVANFLHMRSAQRASRRNNQTKSEFSLKLPSHIAFCRPGFTDDCTNQFLAKF